MGVPLPGLPGLPGFSPRSILSALADRMIPEAEPVSSGRSGTPAASGASGASDKLGGEADHGPRTDGARTGGPEGTSHG
jgi:hypothetical protein